MIRAKLVVLEDVEVRYNLRGNLAQRSEIEVLTASSAWQLMKLLQSEETDLTVFEHWMPDMLGDELLERIRRLPANQDVPVVVMGYELSNAARNRYRQLEPVTVLEGFVPDNELQKIILEKFNLAWRQSERVPVRTQVRIKYQGKILDGVTEDLSLHGAAIVVPKPISRDEKIFFEFADGLTTAGEIAGRVLRVFPNPAGFKLGIEFLSPDETALASVRERILDGSKLQQMLGKVERLPSLPAVVAKILEQSLKEDCSIDEIAALISSDPAMSAYLLKLVNSPAFGFSSKITSVKRAVPLMGLRAVRNAVLGFSVMRHLTADNRGQMAFELWRHSVACAIAAEKLAGYFEVPAEDAFTLGLLHDVGKFILLSEFARMDNGLAGRQLLGGWSIEKERDFFGMDHAEISSTLLARWRVPESIYLPIALHHKTPSEKDPHRQAVRLLQAADGFVYSMHLGTTNGVSQNEWSLPQLSEQQLSELRIEIFRQLGGLAETFGQNIDPAQLCADIVEQANRRLALELEQNQNRVQMLLRAYERTRNNLVSLARQEKHVAIGKLAAGLSHQINNPLAFMQANMKVLDEYLSILAQKLKNQNDQQLQEIVSELPQLSKELQEGFSRVGNIVQALYSFSMDTSGKLEKGNLISCVKEAITLLGHSKKDCVHIVLQAGPVPDILLDTNGMIRVCVEIMNNALEAMSQGGRLLVSLWEKEGKIWLTFKDDGPGIDPESLEHVFEPFYSTRPFGEKRGMGLAVAYGIVARHGGDISIKSEKDKGTLVVVTLPIDIAK